MTHQTMSKGEYAAHRGVSPGRISQYIAEGKIPPKALDGKGRNARVIVEEADRILGARLDPSQSLGANGRAAASLLDARPANTPADPLPDPDAASSVFQTVEQSMLERVAREKARQAELTTAKMEREESLSTGRYMLTEDARRAATKAAAEAIAFADAAMRDIAIAISADFAVEKSAAMAVVSKAWRDIRAKAAERFKAEAEITDEVIEDVAPETEEAGA